MAATSPDGVTGVIVTDEQELRRSSRLFLAELDRLHDLESEKSNLGQGDPRRVALAHEVEDAVAELLGLGRYQTRLIELEAQSVAPQEDVLRSPADILDDWRAAERELRDARAAFERATDRADGLRKEHSQSVRRVDG
jgi:hypothetical protein